MKKTSVVVFTFLLASCTQPSKQQRHFFAFDSLLRNQSDYLASVPVAVSKEVTAGGKTEIVALSLKDSAAWMNELEIFTQLEQLNNPQNIGQYTDKVQADVSSNLTVRTLLATGKQPLREVKIYYLNEPTQLKKITSLVHQKNSLYQSDRQLELVFTEVHNKITLTSYSITGSQHIVLGDSVHFSSGGNISIQ